MNPILNQRMLRITYYVIFLLAIVLIPSAIVHAQDPTPSDDQVNEIAMQLYCPVCENTPLDVCPTEACRQWRALIRQMISEGRTEAEIKQYFVENYGARVLGAPPATGLNWLVYIIPPVIILAGALFLLRALKEWTKPSAASATPGASEAKPVAQDDYVTRLEEELKKRK
ncbi:MAG: cytochrome c-type biogenesis protein CcmH [Anaerolineales bacterium]|nr:cytochrome c-type biogenesis protein CcmH [Anaerolineales bacterium]